MVTSAIHLYASVVSFLHEPVHLSDFSIYILNYLLFVKLILTKGLVEGGVTGAVCGGTGLGAGLSGCGGMSGTTVLSAEAAWDGGV